ncbi:hypothetical protein L9F63_002152, partial [Diploptera punctata]
MGLLRMNYAVLCFVVLSCVTAEKAKFYNYQVHRVIPINEQQLTALKELEENPNGLNFWAGPTRLNKAVDVMVPPDLLPHFEEIISNLNLQSEVFINDVQELINKEEQSQSRRAGFGWTSYHTLNEIYDWLDTLVAKYPGVVTSITGGRSYEGREIKGVKVSLRAGNPGVFIESGIHAREWITPAAVTYILNKLLTMLTPMAMFSLILRIECGERPEVVEIFCAMELIQTGNWDFHWMVAGSSSNPCSDTYAGSSPASEIETQTLAAYITSVADKFDVYLSFHSYSQLLLFPYGHSQEKVSNYNELLSLGNEAAAALAKNNGTRYTVGNIYDAIYPASGGSMDWVRGTFNTPYTYTWELRDTGRYGFLLPAEQIIETAEETLNALVVILQTSKISVIRTNWMLLFLRLSCAVLCIVLLTHVTSEKAKFYNYQVHRIVPTDENQLNGLIELENNPNGLNFWVSPSIVNREVDVMVPPHLLSNFEEILTDLELESEVHIKDVQELIDKEEILTRHRTGFGWSSYHTLDEIYQWLDSLETQYPEIVNGIIGGQSFEGRLIKGVQVVFKEGNPGVFIESGIHAREWITPATVTYFLNKILTSEDVEFRELIESFNYYIFPSVNPDGYVYSHTMNRMWRKTRSKRNESICYGTDPNRNWDYHWM